MAGFDLCSVCFIKKPAPYSPEPRFGRINSTLVSHVTTYRNWAIMGLATIDPHSQKEHTDIHKIPKFGVRACSHGGGGPQVGEVPHLPVVKES